MRFFKSRIFSRIGSFSGSAHQYLMGGAWFFLIFSFGYLGWAVLAGLTQSVGLSIFDITTENGATHAAWGLSYQGIPGLLLALLLAGIVLTGTIGSINRRQRLRRWSQSILLGWSALWMLNFLHLMMVDPSFETVSRTFIMAVLFICTGYRFSLNVLKPHQAHYLPQEKVEEQSSIEAHEPLTPSEVTASNQVVEITPTPPHSHPHPHLHLHKLQDGCFRRCSKTTWTHTRQLGKQAGKGVKSLARMSINLAHKTADYLREKGVLPRSHTTA